MINLCKLGYACSAYGHMWYMLCNMWYIKFIKSNIPDGSFLIWIVKNSWKRRLIAQLLFLLGNRGHKLENIQLICTWHTDSLYKFGQNTDKSSLIAEIALLGKIFKIIINSAAHCQILLCRPTLVGKALSFTHLSLFFYFLLSPCSAATQWMAITLFRQRVLHRTI